jgi:hypothetical protein
MAARLGPSDVARSAIRATEVDIPARLGFISNDREHGRVGIQVLSHIGWDCRQARN